MRYLWVVLVELYCAMVWAADQAPKPPQAPPVQSAYEAAMKAGEPFVCWVNSDCPPCRASTPYAKHVHVGSLPGLPERCCVVCYRGPDGSLVFDRDDVMTGTYETAKLWRLVQFRHYGRPEYRSAPYFQPAYNARPFFSGGCSSCR